MNCRHCNADLSLPFLDLGSAPPSNAFLDVDALNRPEVYLPLRLLVCQTCWLVQTQDFASPETFFSPDYAYFSSVSQSWLAHAEAFAASFTRRLSLNASSLVCEVAANDGYLLQNFVKTNIPCYGIEPTASTARVARAKGIDIVEAFLGLPLATQLVAEGRAADLVVCNNVLAHVPDINDFLASIVTLLKADGVASFEFPHLLSMVQHGQFDTAYHEHFSYLSLTAARTAFVANGLTIIDVEELATHGGSLRVLAQRTESGSLQTTETVERLFEREKAAGLATTAFYTTFQAQAEAIKNDFLSFLIETKRLRRSVVAYGAAAKGNTLLNFAGVRPDLIAFVADRASSKQGRFLPGSRIPVVAEQSIAERKPDYIVVLPWNLQDEVMKQLAYAREWGAQFVTAVPRLTIV